MEVVASPVKEIRKKLQLTQAQFATVAGVSKGHMSEVESGIAHLSDKIIDFLEGIFVDVNEVKKKHEAYIRFRTQKNREAAAKRNLSEKQPQERGN